MPANPLIGTWRLIAWENRSVDGQISYPLGKDALGYLMYNQDGYMCVAIMRPNRVKFATGDLLGGSLAEKVHAAGPLSAIAAKTLQDMGFTNVRYIEGGIEAWKGAGLPTAQSSNSYVRSGACRNVFRGASSVVVGSPAR